MIRCVFIIIAIVLCSCTPKKKDDITAIKTVMRDGISIPVYNFSGLEPLLTTDNDTIRIINFWATWCRPCVVELPYFELINTKYKGYNVEVVLVSLDLESAISSKLIPFIKKQQITSTVIVLDDVDSNTWIPKIDKEWSGAIPATLICKGGECDFYEQSFTYMSLEAALKKML